MSSERRKHPCGESTKGRGNLIAVGVQRKLFAMMAMLAAFATLLAGSLISVNVFAGGDKTYIITYTLSDDESVNVDEEYNALPSQTVTASGDNVTFSTIPTTTKKGLSFYAWRYGSGFGNWYTPSDGSFTVPTSKFTRQGDTDVYVLNLTPYWQQSCRAVYISEKNQYTTTEFKIDYQSTSHNSFGITNPTHSSLNNYAFVVWILDSSDKGAKVVALSDLPYTTENDIEYSWFNTSTGCSSYTDGAWEVKLYAVWTPKIEIIYIDQTVSPEYSKKEKVDPQKFYLMDKSALLLATGRTGNAQYDKYRLRWNTDSGFSGTVYGNETGPVTTLRSDTTLYAQWNIEYEVYYYIKKDDGTYQTSYSFMDRFQRPKDAPGTDLYSFINKDSKSGYEVTGWSTAQDGTKSASIPLSAFPSEFSGSYKVLKVYGEWTPLTYKFVYDVNYDIDGSRTDQLTKPVSGLPEGIDSDNTISITYDNLTDGYQLVPISAEGYQFKGGYIKNRTGAVDGSEKSGDFKIPSGWITETTDNGMDSTIMIRARWHKYNKYTFIYDRNDDGLRSAQKIGETVYPNYYVGSFREATDEAFDTLAVNGSQWSESIYQNQMTDDMYYISGGKYFKLKNGLLPPTDINSWAGA